MAAKPLVFSIRVEDFDLNLIPAEARKAGTEAFNQAVGAYYGTLYGAQGMSAFVNVGQQEIRVVAIPQSGMSPFEFALSLLNDRKIDDAVVLLEALKPHAPEDSNILYNLGIAYSELGRIPEAIAELEHSVKADPDRVNAWVGLGVAHQKAQRNADAERALRKAMTLDPANGWANRNLGAVLMSQGRAKDALPHFREAVHQLPDDPAARFALAQCLESMQGKAEAVEADGIYQALIDRFPNHPTAELARKARTERAHKNLRGATAGGIRMDVVMYLADALQKFSGMNRREVSHITLEIAMLGRSGLDINDPERKYRLKTLPGEFSGLHLLALMHAGVRMFDPRADTGADFDKEYAMAQTMAGKP